MLHSLYGSLVCSPGQSYGDPLETGKSTRVENHSIFCIGDIYVISICICICQILQQTPHRIYKLQVWCGEWTKLSGELPL